MNQSLTLAGDTLSHVLPHGLFKIGDFTVTNHVLMSALAAVLLTVAFISLANQMRRRTNDVETYVTKGRLAQLFETLCEFLRNDMAKPVLGNIADKYIGYIWTTFFFILFCNLLGLVPFGPIIRVLVGGDVHLEHLSGTATGNINMTAGLAVVSFFMIHAIGIREQGIAYFKHFNPAPWYMFWLMIPLEVIGSFIKPFALAVRLFANMVAGHLVLASLLGLIFAFKNLGVAAASLIGSLLFSLLELLVAFLQAYIFTFLTTLFIASGAVHHDDHGHHDDHHEVAAGH